MDYKFKAPKQLYNLKNIYEVDMYKEKMKEYIAGEYRYYYNKTNLFAILQGQFHMAANEHYTIKQGMEGSLTETTEDLKNIVEAIEHYSATIWYH